VTPSRIFSLYCVNKEDWEDWKDAFEFISGITVEQKSIDSGENSDNDSQVEKPLKPKLTLDFAKYGQPDICGYLMKQGNDRIGKWRKRWFFLLGRTLFYCISPESEPIGSVPLSISTITRIYDSPEEHALELTVCNQDISEPILRIFKLRAYDSESLQEWVRHLMIYTSTNP
jgi:hypothetical protein